MDWVSQTLLGMALVALGGFIYVNQLLPWLKLSFAAAGKSERLPWRNDVLPLQQAAIAELIGFGFIPVCILHIAEGNVQSEVAILQHPEKPVFASVSFSPDPLVFYPLGFFSFDDKGGALFTTNAGASILLWPDCATLNVKAKTAAEQLSVHEARLQGVTASALSIDDGVDGIARIMLGIVPFNHARGILIPYKDRYALTWKAAHAAAGVHREERPVRAAQPDATAVAAFLADLHSGFMRTVCEQTTRADGVFWLCLTATASLFAAFVLSFMPGTWGVGLAVYAGVVVLIVVPPIIVLRLFGVKNAHALCLPTLRAKIKWTAIKQTVWMRAATWAIVPALLLLVGSALMPLSVYCALPQVGRIAGVTAFVIGSLLFLPLNGLPGGLLLRLAVPSVRSKIAVRLSLLLAAAAMMAGVFYDRSLFLVATYCYCLTLVEWRLVALRDSCPGEGWAVDRLAALFAAAGGRFGAWSNRRLMNLVAQLQYIESLPKPTRRQSIIILGFLVLCWSLTGAGLWETFRPRAEEIFDAAYHRYERTYDPAGTAKELALMEKYAPKLAEDDKRRNDLLFIRARKAAALSEQQDGVLAALQKGGGKFNSVSELAQNYLSTLSFDKAATSPTVKIAEIEKALAVVDGISARTFVGTIPLRLQLAEQYDRAGKRAKAEAMLDEFLVRLPAASEANETRADIISAKAWLYLDKGETDRALAWLQASPFAAEFEVVVGRNGIDYVWALLLANRREEALAHMLAISASTRDKPEAGGPIYVYPADLIYVYRQVGHADEARSVFEAQRKQWSCDAMDEPYAEGVVFGPWQGKRQKALHAALVSLCTAVK